MKPVGYGKQCLLVWVCVEERGRSCNEVKGQKEKNGVQRGHGRSRLRKCEDLFEKGRCTLPIK